MERNTMRSHWWLYHKGPSCQNKLFGFMLKTMKNHSSILSRDGTGFGVKEITPIHRMGYWGVRGEASRPTGR